MKEKKIIIIASIIIGVLTLTLGVTFAIFNFSKVSVNSKLVLGDIYMHYNEPNQGINLEGMMPIDEYLQKTAEWNTVPNPYKLKGHNNIKFHWYKKRMYAMLGTIQICIGHKHLVLMMQYKQAVKFLSQEQQL